MAVVGLSEFTFGYGFLYEQTQKNWQNLRFAPVLPSLVQEAHDAWDARLPTVGTDFYFQFKLSDYLERRNSRFHRDGTYWGPYYRFGFHRHNGNQQHRRLWRHSQVNDHTCYVAPEFRAMEEFNDAFLARRLSECTRIIPLNQCDDCVDGEQHFITFEPGSEGWVQHSTPKKKTLSYRGAESEKLYRLTAESWRPIDSVFARDLLDRSISIVKKVLEVEGRGKLPFQGEETRLLDGGTQREGRVELLHRAAKTVAVFMGASMVLVGDAT